MASVEASGQVEAGDLWAKLLGKLEVGIDGLSKHLTKRNELDVFAREINIHLPFYPPTASGTLNVFAVGSPEPGYWWSLRAIRLLGPKSAVAPIGTELFNGNVNFDVYVSAAPSSAIAVPPSADWIGGNQNAASPGTTTDGVPYKLDFAVKEAIVNPGDFVVVSAYGTGVGTLQLAGSITVIQYAGLSGLRE